MRPKSRRKNRLLNNKDHSKIANKVNPLDPKVPQEVLAEEKNNDFDKKKTALANETQQYMYNQSSKFSSVSRNLIFGIMGTIWAFSFKNGEVTLNNFWLVLAIFLCIAYLMLDVIHYYTDSKFYNKEQYKLDSYTNEQDLQEHEIDMDLINKSSNNFIKWKFRLLILTSIIFLIGIIFQTNLFGYFINLTDGITICPVMGRMML